MNLKNNFEIITFLKQVSYVYREIGNEIIIHCPYCDDALRPNAKSHGHLYISNEQPVFHCFRCEISGHISSLLIDLGFTNINLIKELGNSSYIFRKEKKLFEISKNKNNKRKSIFEQIKEKNEKFSLGDKDNYCLFEKYIYDRLGKYCDYNQFLITPDFFNKNLYASFYNIHGNFVTARAISDNVKWRYYREKNNSELYFFQPLDFELYHDIVIAEGVFDVLNLYRFSDIFMKQPTFYLAMLGKNYGKVITWLASHHLVLGHYNFHIVFDNDFKFYNKILNLCKKIINRININIKINGYKPTISNDAGDYPFLTKI